MGVLSILLLGPCEVPVLLGFRAQLPFPCTSIRLATVLPKSCCSFGILSLQTLGSYRGGIGRIFLVLLGQTWKVTSVKNLGGWLGDSNTCTQKTLHKTPSNHPSIFTGWTWALIILRFPLEGVSFIWCVCVLRIFLVCVVCVQLAFRCVIHIYSCGGPTSSQV